MATTRVGFWEVWKIRFSRSFCAQKVALDETDEICPVSDITDMH